MSQTQSDILYLLKGFYFNPLVVLIEYVCEKLLESRLEEQTRRIKTLEKEVKELKKSLLCRPREYIRIDSESYTPEELERLIDNV